LAQFAVPKFSNAIARWKTDSSETIDLISYPVALSVGIAQARLKLSDKLTINRKENNYETDTVSTPRGLADVWPAGQLAG
jgi:hypothetical protein